MRRRSATEFGEIGHGRVGGHGLFASIEICVFRPTLCAFYLSKERFSAQKQFVRLYGKQEAENCCEKNIKKAANAARKKRTIAHLPKAIRTALGKQASKVARCKAA